jgi:hypothetical protein
MTCGALVRTRHAVEVLGAAHGLEVAANKQQLHLGKDYAMSSVAHAPGRRALMLRLFSASAIVA